MIDLETNAIKKETVNFYKQLKEYSASMGNEIQEFKSNFEELDSKSSFSRKLSKLFEDFQSENQKWYQRCMETTLEEISSKMSNQIGQSLVVIQNSDLDQNVC